MSDKAKILIVDDDAVMRQVLRRDLEKEGYQVSTLEDARTLPERLREFSPDLLLLDVILPGVTGTEACRNLRMDRQFRDLPVIMLTALSRPTDVVSGLESGANDYIAKPVNGDELRARVATHLRHSRMARELVSVEKQLSLGRLTAGLCHEVNNPLTVVLGQLELLGNLLSDDKHKRYAKLAHESAKRIQKLVKAMRDYSEPVIHAWKECDINGVVENAISIASLAWSSGGTIQLERRLCEDLPNVLGDQEKLQQVFINFLMNASQVMAGGGTIVASTGVKDGQVFAAITDTGRGIAKAHLDRIFDPFWTTKDNWNSPGLGLSVARRIVEEHNGRIEVVSEEGKGSTFSVILPEASKAVRPPAIVVEKGPVNGL